MSYYRKMTIVMWSAVFVLAQGVVASYGLNYDHLGAGLLLIAAPFAIAAGRLLPLDIEKESHKSGFTLIEMLVVMGIIAVLVGLTLPVVSTIRQGNRRDATRLLIEKTEAALDEYKTQVGHYPEGIPDRSDLEAWIDANQYDRARRAIVRGNLAVAEVVMEKDSFTTAGGGHVRELVQDTPKGGLVRNIFPPDERKTIPERPYLLVDSYYRNQEDLIPVPVDLQIDKDKIPDTLSHTVLCITREGVNQPGLDIWSCGPNEINNVLAANREPPKGTVSDDVRNW